MIDLRQAFNIRKPSFLISAVVTAVILGVVYPWAFPGESYRYDVTAHWTEDGTGTLLVTGDLHIRRPCPGSTVTSVYEFADKLNPQPAVRTGHIEAAMVGKSTVAMDVARAGAVPVAVTFQPPDGALGIRWLLRHHESCVDDARRGIVEVGYARIPPRP